MVTRDPLAQGLMGTNKDTLSHMDKRTANLMYKCNGGSLQKFDEDQLYDFFSWSPYMQNATLKVICGDIF